MKFSTNRARMVVVAIGFMAFAAPVMAELAHTQHGWSGHFRCMTAMGMRKGMTDGN